MNKFNYSLWASRLDHRARWLKQRFRRPDIAIAGGYHSGNLGDMALARSAVGQIERILRRQPQRLGVQTLYNLEDWPVADTVILGGGSILSQRAVQALRNYSDNSAENIAIIGVDFAKEDLHETDSEFLRAVPFFSVRNSVSLIKVREKYRLENARLAPDIVFSCDDSIFGEVKVRSNNKPVLGINVVSGMGRDQGRRVMIENCKSFISIGCARLRNTIFEKGIR